MKKQDEMEMYITLKSVRIAWAYTILFLLVWSVYGVIQTGRLGLPFFLMISQNTVFFCAQLIFRRRLTAGNHEE